MVVRAAGLVAVFPALDPGAHRGPEIGAGDRRRRSAVTSPAMDSEPALADVLARYSGGPDDGVFTDGSADPNPGPGGWGAVFVRDGTIIASDRGHEEHTTNNRMELTAIIAGLALVPDGDRATVYSDSRLCVDTLTSWAHAWKRRGWRRKGGEVANVDLVREAYERLHERPGVELRWIKAHDGSRWNEYADVLAGSYRREGK